MSAIGGEFDKAVAFLRARGIPFTLRTRDSIQYEDCEADGLCSHSDSSGYWIFISRNCEYPIDTLLHEYAHVVQHHRHGEWGDDHEKQHNRKWSDAYSRIYRDYHSWFTAQQTGS